MKTIVRFKNHLTFYLLLVYTLGLLLTVFLFIDLNTKGYPDNYGMLLWTSAGICTDIPLMLVYSVRCSCVFATNTKKLLALKIFTGLCVGIVGLGFSVLMAQHVCVIVQKLPETPNLQRFVLPTIDVVIPMYLFIAEILFVIKFLNAVAGNEKVKNVYKFVMLWNTTCMMGLAIIGVTVQIISYKNGEFGTSLYLLTRIFGFYQTTEYGISLRTIMENISRSAGHSGNSSQKVLVGQRYA